MLAKTESAAQVAALAPLDVVALVETPRGALFAAEIAAAERTVADDVGRRGPDRRPGRQLQPAGRRHATAMWPATCARRSCWRPGVRPARARRGASGHPRPRGLARGGDDAAAVGFDVKVCIHPSQVAVMRKAYRPERPKSWTGRAGCWPRPRASAACSHSKGRWSTPRCCGTRKRRCAGQGSPCRSERGRSVGARRFR